MHMKPQILIYLFIVLTSCISSGDWVIEEVNLPHGEVVYLKSWTYGFRGEHNRTIISRHRDEKFRENEDIDIGQFVPIRYKIENGKFILIETSNYRHIQDQFDTLESIEIDIVSTQEYLDSSIGYTKNFYKK